jgi:hypothetical protein
MSERMNRVKRKGGKKKNNLHLPLLRARIKTRSKKIAGMYEEIKKEILVHKSAESSELAFRIKPSQKHHNER